MTIEPIGMFRATSWVEVTDPRRRTSDLVTLGKLTETVKRHRAIVLVAMMLLTLGLVVVMTASGIASFDGRSLIALAVVVLAAAAGGVVFSWNRYFKRP